MLYSKHTLAVCFKLTNCTTLILHTTATMFELVLLDPGVLSASLQHGLQELAWYDEVLSAELRSGDASSFADR